jgi:hypothetical protein
MEGPLEAWTGPSANCFRGRAAIAFADDVRTEPELCGKPPDCGHEKGFPVAWKPF